jgi:NAD(P)-dependent dehydrogenase (short-subunit alcohol dehydrogenase family)
MKKFFLIGSSSFLLKNIEKFLSSKNHEIVLISSKVCKNKKKIKCYLTDYSESSLKKILKKEIQNTKFEPVFIFGNVVTQSELFANVDEKFLDIVLEVNIKLPLRIIKIVLKEFLINKPIFFNISSIRVNPGVGYSLYGSSKIFMENIFKNLAMEYGRLGCIFKTIRLGIVSGGLGTKLSERVIQDCGKRSSIKGFVDIREIVDTILFEIKKKSSNGKVIHCDNGYF